MLRIKGSPQVAPAAQVEDVPQEGPDDTQEPLSAEPDQAMPTQAQADPMVAGYKGPEQGPFMCSNCIFWQEPEACSLVSGPISPDGICSLFTSMAAQVQADGVEPGQEPGVEPPPPDAPVGPEPIPQG